jgi:hypothetical protein
MASTAMRLVIIAACAGAFYVLIGGFHSKFPLPLSFFETQGCARPDVMKRKCLLESS